MIGSLVGDSKDDTPDGTADAKDDDFKDGSESSCEEGSIEVFNEGVTAGFKEESGDGLSTVQMLAQHLESVMDNFI